MSTAINEEDVVLEMEPPVYKRRYFMLFLFSLSSMTTAAGWICFAPIFDLIQSYGQSPFTVNYLSISYMILFLPAQYPCSLLMNKYGLRVGLTVGIILTVVGAWLRCLINSSFSYAIAGQTLMALA